MSDKKNEGTGATLMGLPEVGNTAPTLEPLPAVNTAPTLDQVTSPTLPPVTTPPLAPPKTRTGAMRAHQGEPPPAPPKTKTGGMRAQLGEPPPATPKTKTGGMRAQDGEPPPAPPKTKTGGMRAQDGEPPPRTKTGGGVIPKVDTAPRRASRVAQATPQDSVSTGEFAPHASPKKEKYEWTLPRVAGLAGGIGLIFVLTWVFWPSGKSRHPVTQNPEPIAVEDDAPVPTPKPKPVAPIAVVPTAPSKPTIKLDAKNHVIDPYAAHLPDLELDAAHKYRLAILRDDSHLGTALARLDEKGGWGVMRKMASHAVLQFGGAKNLRMHCEPGTHFQDGQTLPLELTDLATRQKTAVPVNPALHCWDFEVARVMELGEGVKKRVRVPTDSKVVLGEKVQLRVAYILESLGEKKEWRTGVLGPGESVLAEGRTARFAILDPYAGDNEGTVDLELLSGNTENSGLVTPSVSGAQFVVPKPQ